MSRLIHPDSVCGALLLTPPPSVFKNNAVALPVAQNTSGRYWLTQQSIKRTERVAKDRSHQERSLNRAGDICAISCISKNRLKGRSQLKRFSHGHRQHLTSLKYVTLKRLLSDFMQHSQQFNLRLFVKSCFKNKRRSSGSNNPTIKVLIQKNTFWHICDKKIWCNYCWYCKIKRGWRFIGNLPTLSQS